MLEVSGLDENGSILLNPESPQSLSSFDKDGSLKLYTIEREKHKFNKKHVSSETNSKMCVQRMDRKNRERSSLN